MNPRRTFLSLVLACLGALALFTSSAAAQSPGTLCVHHGKAHGAWSFANSNTPNGQALGVLFENDAPRFVFRANLVPDPPNGASEADGAILGHLFLITPSGVSDTPFAVVRGFWVNGPDGKGVFEARLLRPSSAGGGLHVVGRFSGHFLDTPSEGGTFRGKWLLYS